MSLAVQLDASQRIVQISSKDRINADSTTASNFTIQLGYDGHMSSIKAIAVKEIQLTNSFYNININNNVFYFLRGAVETSITVAVGQYTLAQLQTALVAEFAALGAPIVFSSTLGTNTQKLTFTTDLAISWSKYRPASTTVNPMAKVLGINSMSDVESTSHVAGSIVDLAGVKSIYVISNQLAGGAGVSSKNGGQKISLLDVVPMDVAFGAVKTHESEGETDIHIYNDNLRNNLSLINIEVRDEDLNLLDMNGSEIVIVVKVFL